MSEEAKKKPRGFAVMTPEQRSRIGRLGGVAAHAKGTAHEFTPEEAREAGRKGGQAVARKYGEGHMSQIGTNGYEKSKEAKAEKGN